MSQITDVRAAIVAILKADADVATEVGIRVFGDELPRSETDSMAQKCVVVAPAGGPSPGFSAGTLPIEVQRLDVFCYAETLYGAEEVRRAVYGALKGIKRITSANVLVHWVRPAGGAVSNRDPVSDWPVCWNSWQVMSDERATA